MLTRLRQLGLAAVLLAPLVAAPTAEASRGARPGGEASARGERPKASGPRLLPGRRLRQVTPRRALLQSNKITAADRSSRSRIVKRNARTTGVGAAATTETTTTVYRVGTGSGMRRSEGVTEKLAGARPVVILRLPD